MESGFFLKRNNISAVSDNGKGDIWFYSIKSFGKNCDGDCTFMASAWEICEGI